MTNEELVRALWRHLDAQDWDGLRGLLSPDLVATWVASGETFDREGFVRVNRDYPGRWYVDVLDVFAASDRVVSRCLVHDADRSEQHHVASFFTVRAGLVAELTEVWAEAGAAIPSDRRPA